jgi:hypothetical protein
MSSAGVMLMSLATRIVIGPLLRTLKTAAAKIMGPEIIPLCFDCSALLG